MDINTMDINTMDITAVDIIQFKDGAWRDSKGVLSFGTYKVKVAENTQRDLIGYVVFEVTNSVKIMNDGIIHWEKP